VTHPGYQLTEWAYSHPWLTPEAKLVLGVTLQWPERNPSVRQLADVLPLNKDTIILAQTELEVEGIARYDRPKKRRSKTDARFEDSNRLAWVHPKAEPNRRRQDAERGAFLPSEVAERLPRGVRGKKNAKHFPLIALVYAHEQARAGRVAIQDDAVGAILGLNARQVRTMRQQLIAAGIIVKATYVPLLGKSYRLVGTPAPAITFEAGKVKRASLLHGVLPNPQASVLIVASKYELAYLRTLLDQLDAEACAAVVTDAQTSEGGAAEAFGIGAAALIEAAKLRLAETGVEASNDRSREHQMTVLGNVYLVPSPRPIRTVTPTQALSSTQNKRRTSDEDGLRRKDQRAKRHRERKAPALRDVVPEKNLRVRADDETHAAMTEGLAWLESKYGKAERDAFAREWVVNSGGSGKTFLKLMHHRFPALKPREDSPAGGKDRSAELAAMFATMTPAADEADVWDDE